MRNQLIALTLAAAVLPLSPAMARQSNGYVVRTTTMRAGPAYDYPAVQRLYRNSSVAVYGCLRDWSWCDVGNRYARGWVGRGLMGRVDALEKESGRGSVGPAVWLRMPPKPLGKLRKQPTRLNGRHSSEGLRRHL